MRISDWSSDVCSSDLLTGTNVSVNGQRQKLGTGEILEGGLGEGVATSADMVSKYLIERAEQYKPVIEMPTGIDRSEEHTSELQSLMRNSYAVFCLKKNNIA